MKVFRFRNRNQLKRMIEGNEERVSEYKYVQFKLQSLKR